MKIRNILVPVDFSPPSRLAVNHAVSIARRFRARLTLAHILEAPSLLTLPLSEDSKGLEKKDSEQAVRLLSALVAPEDQDDLDLRIVIKSGDIKDGILSAVREHEADMVVIGTHGRSLIGRWLIGSVTQAILRKVPVPILTVCHAARPLALGRILFATDLRENYREGFSFALNLARAMHSDLVILHVTEPTSLTFGGAGLRQSVSGNYIEEAKSRLAEFVTEGKRLKVKVETAVVEGDAAQEILKTTEESTADLILITIHKKGLVERALLGTTAERVIRESQVPVLSIPAGVAFERDQVAGPHTTASSARD